MSDAALLAQPLNHSRSRVRALSGVCICECAMPTLFNQQQMGVDINGGAAQSQIEFAHQSSIEQKQKG